MKEGSVGLGDGRRSASGSACLLVCQAVCVCGSNVKLREKSMRGEHAAKISFSCRFLPFVAQSGSACTGTGTASPRLRCLHFPCIFIIIFAVLLLKQESVEERETERGERAGEKWDSLRTATSD